MVPLLLDHDLLKKHKSLISNYTDVSLVAKDVRKSSQLNARMKVMAT